MFNNNPPPKKSAIYEIMWKNMAAPDRPQATIRRVRTACWITKAAYIYSGYVVLTACPQQPWLRETRLSVFQLQLLVINTIYNQDVSHRFLQVLIL